MRGWTSLSPAWRQALPALAFALLAVLLLYRETAVAMVMIWHRSETYAHAFVVPPIAMWLIWRKRDLLFALSPKPSLWFAAPVLGFVALWFLGELVSANSITQLALVGMLVFVVPTVLGWPLARVIAFPLGFLFFAVPIGEFMTPYLMEWTADFTVTALRISGIPVYREGQDFVIPSGNWSVVEACSGIRYLMASVMVGTLFAYLNFHSLKKRWVFVAVSFLLPVLANWFRAYFIVMLGHYSGNKLAVGADHLVYGWVFFGIIMLAMFMVGARWSDPEPESEAIVRTPAAESLPLLAQAWPILALLSLLGLAPVALQQLDARNGKAPVQLSLPDLARQGWELESAVNPPWLPSYSNASADLQASWRKIGADGKPRQVALYVAYYRDQSYSSKLISSNNELTRSQDRDWVSVKQGRGELALQEMTLPLRWAELRGHGPVLGSADLGFEPRLTVKYLFWVDGQLTSSDAKAKLYGAFKQLKGRGDDAAAVFVSAVQAQEGETEAILDEFLRDNWADLAKMLSEARESAHNGLAAR